MKLSKDRIRGIRLDAVDVANAMSDLANQIKVVQEGRMSPKEVDLTGLYRAEAFVRDNKEALLRME